MTIHTLCAAIIDAHEKAQECPGTEAAKVFTRDMQDAIHQLVSQYGWRDMEDAPEDDAGVIVRGLGYDDSLRIGEASFGGYLHRDNEWAWANDSCSCCHGPMPSPPTAWMPLPTANPGGSAPRGEG